MSKMVRMLMLIRSMKRTCKGIVPAEIQRLLRRLVLLLLLLLLLLRVLPKLRVKVVVPPPR